jgi:hypothetical protein
MAQGVLAILGSGETAPGMTKIHREMLESLKPRNAVNIDSAYGFQLNVPQMSEKLEEYFDTSLHLKMTTLHFPSYERASELERTLFKQQVRQADYVFAGPGSPTYALAQWAPLHFEEDLLSVLDKAGGLCFASAASLTLGAYTAPIYEIYKVGDQSPQWQEGLNVLSHFGLKCVVIPHFDNNEGGNYDTRYCYLGEVRLTALEVMLPEDVATLGVDEHTAAIIDLDSDTITVKGRSNAYWRQNGNQKILANGTTTDLDQLRNAAVTPRTQPSVAEPPSEISPTDLALLAASGGEEATSALAQLVQLAATGGEGYVDPAPLIEGVLKARVSARSSGQYALADELRDVLVAAGFEIRDEASGTVWTHRTNS